MNAPNVYDDPAEYDRLTPGEQRALQAWIALAVQPASRPARVTSYSMKHHFEAVGFYVTNGQFKGAMLATGYEPVDRTRQNWTFRIRPRWRCRDDTHAGNGLDGAPPAERRKLAALVALGMAEREKRRQALLSKECA